MDDTTGSSLQKWMLTMKKVLLREYYELCEGGVCQDMLTEERDNQETEYANHQEKNIRNKMMLEALDYLKPREKDIIIKRRLTENPKTLEELSQEYKVSRERIRQIETRAFEKLQTVVKSKAKELKLIELS